jgi:hypothetical protein
MSTKMLYLVKRYGNASMKQGLSLLLLSVIALIGCTGRVAQHHVDRCKRATDAFSAARISCLQEGAKYTADEDRRKQAIQLQLEEERRRAQIERQCESYGFKKQTTPFSQCVMQIDVAQRELRARQEKLDQERAQRESACKLQQAQAYLAPSRTGSFAESNDKAMTAYSNCMAGLPPQQPLNMICNKQGKDGFYCFAQ